MAFIIFEGIKILGFTISDCFEGFHIDDSKAITNLFKITYSLKLDFVGRPNHDKVSFTLLFKIKFLVHSNNMFKNLGEIHARQF